MKKILICFIGILTLISLTVSANAAGQSPVTVSNTDGTYTTSGVDSTLANQQVTIIVHKGDEASFENVEYIDQTSADANGAYSFSNYTPKEAATASTGSFEVLIGAQSLASPLYAGTIYPGNVTAKPFGITTDGTLGRSGGIQATVTVTPTPGVTTHGGKEVVLFQLMKGTTPINIVAIERDITSSDDFTAYFNVDPSDTSYLVRAYVLDSFSSDVTTSPVSLAEKQTLN